MNEWKMTRRSFLSLTASLGVITLLGCPLTTGQGVIIYRRSGRRRHVSNAAKKHNANRLYLTQEAAARDLPHAGDRSKVVSIFISYGMFLMLFSDGKLIADLRRDLKSNS